MHDDDDDFRRLNYRAMFGTTVEAEAEAEAEARESAERQRQIDRDETLAWARQRAEVRDADMGNIETSRRREVPTDGAGNPLNDPRNRLEPEVVTKSTAAQADRSHANVMSKEWQDYIKRKLDQQQRVMMKVIAQMAVDEERRREKADADIVARLDEIAQLRAEVAELRVVALRRTETSTDAEARKRAGEIRRAQQQVDRLRVA